MQNEPLSSDDTEGAGGARSVKSTETTMAQGYRHAYISPYLLLNLAILAFCWATTNFNFYLTDFYIEQFSGNLFANAVALRISEIVAYLLAFPIVVYFGAKTTFRGAYMISGLAMLVYLTGLPSSPKGYALCLLVANFGVALTFTPLFLQTNALFPTTVSASVFALCNIFARLVTIFAPTAAKVQGNFCIWIFFTTTLACSILTSNLKSKEEIKA
jgi:hypothetical protein